jgi:hypothetical protein
MSDRPAHNPRGIPTPIAAFDVRRFARESERAYVAAEAFTPNEVPTSKHTARSESPPSSSGGAFMTIGDGVFIDVDRVPVLAVPRDEFAWFDLDDVASRLVLRIDGETTVRALIASGMFSRADVATALDALTRDGLIHFR